jgi:hypothetical protein
MPPSTKQTTVPSADTAATVESFRVLIAPTLAFGFLGLSPSSCPVVPDAVSQYLPVMIITGFGGLLFMIDCAVFRVAMITIAVAAGRCEGLGRLYV